MPSPKIVSERTLGNRAKRVVLDHAALDAITMAVADGAFELAKSIVGGAHVPDAPDVGKGLVQGGGVLAFVGSKRVGAWSTGPVLPFAKPRAAKLSAGITVIGGFGFPGRFVEAGTVHMAAHPFLTPALMDGVPDAEGFIKLACIKHGILSAERRKAGDVFGGTPSATGLRQVRAVKRVLGKAGPKA